MFDSLKFKRLAREAAPGWADEAIELFGYNAEDVMCQQLAVHRYPERYSFEVCLKEIRRRRKLTAPRSPSAFHRLLGALRLRLAALRSAPLEA